MAIRSDAKCWPTMRQLFHLLFAGDQSEYFCCHLGNRSSISTRVQVRQKKSGSSWAAIAHLLDEVHGASRCHHLLDLWSVSEFLLSHEALSHAIRCNDHRFASLVKHCFEWTREQADSVMQNPLCLSWFHTTMVQLFRSIFPRVLR